MGGAAKSHYKEVWTQSCGSLVTAYYIFVIYYITHSDSLLVLYQKGHPLEAAITMKFIAIKFNHKNFAIYYFKFGEITGVEIM